MKQTQIAGSLVAARTRSKEYFLFEFTCFMSVRAYVDYRVV